MRGIKFDKKCAILQICKCNSYSEVDLLIAADGSVIIELTEDHVARINSTVKKEIPWQQKIYNLLRRKLQLSMQVRSFCQKVIKSKHISPSEFSFLYKAFGLFM